MFFSEQTSEVDAAQINDDQSDGDDDDTNHTDCIVRHGRKPFCQFFDLVGEYKIGKTFDDHCKADC